MCMHVPILCTIYFKTILTPPHKLKCILFNRYLPNKKDIIFCAEYHETGVRRLTFIYYTFEIFYNNNSTR